MKPYYMVVSLKYICTYTVVILSYLYFMEWFYEALHYENNLPSSHLSLLISKRRTEKIANSWQLAKTGKSAWKEVKFTNLKRMIRNAENQRLTKSTKVWEDLLIYQIW